MSFSVVPVIISNHKVEENMKAKYTGKTKDIYQIDENTCRMVFKDSVTGKDGVFDPGENQVGLEIEGMGALNLRVSTMFFEALQSKGIKTHFIGANLEEASMEVVRATPFGKGLEIICRYRAVGSFLKRYGLYVEEGQKLDAYVEATLKDDDRQDPLVTREGLEALGIMTEDEFIAVKKSTQEIAAAVQEVLDAKGLELYDIKFEFGRDPEGNVILIDEISSGNMRVYRGDEKLDPITLSTILLEN